MCARRRTYLLLLRQKKVGQEKTTLLPVSPIALGGAGGSLRCSKLGCASQLTAFPLRANSVQTSAASQMTKRVCPAAHTPPQLLRFSARSEGGGNGPHTGHCFARPNLPRCASAWASRLINPKPSAARSASPTSGAAAKAAAAFDPAPTPSGCAEKRRSWGGRVCRRTHTLRRLARRCCLSGVRRTQRVHRRPPQIRASQAAPVRPTGRAGDADWGPPSLW